MNELANTLREEFHGKEYRHAYADEFLNSYIATQIKVLREQRGWNQEQLAGEADMKQSRISLLENVNYSSWSITTLRRLAEAFDVALNVSFETFGDRLRDILNFNRKILERAPFDEDPAFQNPNKEVAINTTEAGTLKHRTEFSEDDSLPFWTGNDQPFWTGDHQPFWGPRQSNVVEPYKQPAKKIVRMQSWKERQKQQSSAREAAMTSNEPQAKPKAIGY